MLKRAIGLIPAVLITLLSLTAGVAFAHNVNCYTAVGYTITCSPKVHNNTDAFGNVQFGYSTGSTATQPGTGSFYWNAIRITNGYEYQPAEFGDTYVWQENPFSRLYYDRLWYCTEVSSISYSEIDFAGSGLYNGTTVGNWLQYSNLSTDCYSPVPYDDYLSWNAY